MAYDNTDSGVLFKNEKKMRDDNRPNYTGKINVGGVEKRLAAWVKTDRNGKPFMSLKVTDDRPQRQDSSEASREAAQPVKPQDHQAPLDDDSEIPF